MAIRLAGRDFRRREQVLRRLRREEDPERRASALSILHPRATTMQLGEPSHQRQPYPHAG